MPVVKTDNRRAPKSVSLVDYNDGTEVVAADTSVTLPAPPPVMAPKTTGYSIPSHHDHAPWLRPTLSVAETPISGDGTVAHIVIVYEELRLFAYGSSGNRPLMEVPIALGKQYHQTKLGDYTVSDLYLDPQHRPSEDVMMDEDLPGGGPIAPWRSFARETRAEGNPNGLGAAWIGLSGNGTNGIGIHGTNDPTSIGTFASDGCVRMRNKDALWLARHCRVGVDVHVTSITDKRGDRD